MLQPVLHWTGSRSDWINVMNNPLANATGDGQTDDTAALQTVLTNITGNETNGQMDYTNPWIVVYFPPGTFRISATLRWGRLIGAQFLGHGRLTKIVWAGAAMGIMLRDQGCTKTRYAGVHWDGAGIAKMGVLHESTFYYETELHHESERFSNFVGAAVAFVHNDSHPIAASEVMYRNTIFENSQIGVLLQNFVSSAHMKSRQAIRKSPTCCLPAFSVRL
jgi:hypothetical protein